MRFPWHRFISENDSRNRVTCPWLASGVFLSLLLGGVIALQTVGHTCNYSLVRQSFWLAVFPAFWLTYCRCFAFTAKDALALFLTFSILLLWLFGINRYPDFTADGMGYHQPAAYLLLEGWNPFDSPAEFRWMALYPSAIWGVQAGLAAVGGHEASALLNSVWLAIAVPVWLSGIRALKPNLTGWQYTIAVLAVLNPVVLVQLATHYVDAALYLAGLAFFGALFLHEASSHRAAARMVMAVCILFIVNAKLSGLYHAVVLCSITIMFCWLRRGRVPLHFALFLFVVGITATLWVGYRPYVTNLQHYGTPLPFDAGQFAEAQRPSNWNGLPPPARFVASLFSVTGGDLPRAPSTPKFPWQVRGGELYAGYPDLRHAGFGPLFALGLIATLLLFFRQTVRAPPDTHMVSIAVLLLASSAFFPESGWARYVPFAYLVPFLLLLALPADGNRWAAKSIAVIFALNILIMLHAAIHHATIRQGRFEQALADMRSHPNQDYFFVPPGSDYRTYNRADLVLTPRFAVRGADVPLRPEAPCLLPVAEFAEFTLCAAQIKTGPK